MKKFLLKILAWLGVGLALAAISVLFADGFFDTTYKRFTNGYAQHSIIGTSRSAQGIYPEIVSASFALEDKSLLNNSFDILTSPYGEIYLDFLKKKLDTSEVGNLYILSVHPMCLSRDLRNPEHWEIHSPTGKTNSVNSDPNIEFLSKNQTRGWGQIIFLSVKFRFIKKLLDNREFFIANYPDLYRSKFPNAYMYLHENGRLEITLKLEDQEFLDKRRNKTGRLFASGFSLYELSDYRFEYLEQTIEFLKRYGDVALVRLPVHEFIYGEEEAHFPEFSIRIKELASRNNVIYLDYGGKGHQYRFTDGSHLLKSEGMKFTTALCDTLKTLKFRQ